jgi:hypothetical protein
VESIEYREHAPYPYESESDHLDEREEPTDDSTIREKRMLELAKQEAHNMYDDHHEYENTYDRVGCIDECEICGSPVRSYHYIAIEHCRR